MSNHYVIITHEQALRDFAKWLRPLKPWETYYVGVFARSKYSKAAGIGTFNSDKHHCKRFTTSPERLVEKLRQCECPLGSYVVKGGLAVPQEAIASYITVNPRDHVKATRHALVKFAELIAAGSTHHNPHQEAMTAIHKSVGTKYYLDVDFDGVSFDESWKAIEACINLEAVEILNTRGGFHALIDLERVDPSRVKTWYKKLMELPGVDIRGDNMIPIPGTYQGGHTPTLFHSRQLV